MMTVAVCSLIRPAVSAIKCSGFCLNCSNMGEASEQSDVDLLVYFAQRKSLLAMVALERQMSAALGRKVDLLTEAALSPYLCDTIKNEMVVIYEAR
jgi:hypothetical protein